jgi:hypothetical protein|tara:strand:+ start:692 stop:1159 length:468 start_codon:yes stop_codon:yes gene_type:complete
MKLVRIPAEQLDTVWSLIEKDIKDALAYSGNLTSSSFVLEKSKENKFQVWVLWDKDKKTTREKYFGVVVTEIIKRELGKVCHIYIMTGRQRHKWQFLVKDIEQFAIDEDCLMMELIARPGWKRILNNFDYKMTHVVLEKKLNNKEKQNVRNKENK